MNAGETVLETPRLLLRCLTGGDVDRLLGIFSDPEAMRYYPGTKDRSETEQWIAWNRDMYERYGYGLWAVHDCASGEFLGQAGLVRQEVEGAAETEIGYLFLRRFWGRGLAAEAARSCRDYGFETLGKTRLISLIDPRNAASRRVAERTGMALVKEIVKWGKPICVYAIERE